MHSSAFGDAFASAGRVSRAKMAPNFIEIFGNSTEKRRFLSRNACQQRQRSSEKAVHRVFRACNDALVCLSGFARESVAVMALISKFLHAKSRDFRPQNCAISAPNARSTRNKRAQNQIMHFMCRATLFCEFFTVFAGAGRVSRAKIAAGWDSRKTGGP